jgi:hypothetical protein
VTLFAQVRLPCACVASLFPKFLPNDEVVQFLPPLARRLPQRLRSPLGGAVIPATQPSEVRGARPPGAVAVDEGTSNLNPHHLRFVVVLCDVPWR